MTKAHPQILEDISVPLGSDSAAMPERKAIMRRIVYFDDRPGTNMLNVKLMCGHVLIVPASKSQDVALACFRCGVSA